MLFLWWLASESLFLVTFAICFPRNGIQGWVNFFQDWSLLWEISCYWNPSQSFLRHYWKNLVLAVEIALDEVYRSGLSEAVSEKKREVILVNKNWDHTFKLGPELKNVTDSKFHDDGDKAFSSNENATSPNQGSDNVFIQYSSWVGHLKGEGIIMKHSIRILGSTLTSWIFFIVNRKTPPVKLLMMVN